MKALLWLLGLVSALGFVVAVDNACSVNDTLAGNPESEAVAVELALACRLNP